MQGSKSEAEASFDDFDDKKVSLEIIKVLSRVEG